MAEEYISSSDEAPEEVALSVGKSQETTRRKRERASQTQQRHLVKRGNKRQHRESSDIPQSGAIPSADSSEAQDDDLPAEVIESLAQSEL